MELAIDYCCYFIAVECGARVLLREDCVEHVYALAF